MSIWAGLPGTQRKALSGPLGFQLLGLCVTFQSKERKIKAGAWHLLLCPSLPAGEKGWDGHWGRSDFCAALPGREPSWALRLLPSPGASLDPLLGWLSPFLSSPHSEPAARWESSPRETARTLGARINTGTSAPWVSVQARSLLARCKIKMRGLCPGPSGWVGRSPARELQGCGFKSGPGHVPGLQVPCAGRGEYGGNRLMWLSQIHASLSSVLLPRPPTLSKMGGKHTPQ